MFMPAERFDFRNAEGQTLAALLDRPDGEIRAVALFAHCFICDKHNRAARHIADGLARHCGAAVRFHRPGRQRRRVRQHDVFFERRRSGRSRRSSAPHARRADDPDRAQPRRRRCARRRASHRRGAGGGDDCRALRPAHVAGLFPDRVAEIKDKGEVEVALAGRSFRIRRALLDDIAEQNLSSHISNLRKALLVFHSPTDDTVGIDNASHIFTTAKHPKSFISLAGADHLLSHSSDAVYVAHVVAAWAERYLDMAADAGATQEVPEGTVVVRETRNGQFQQEIAVGKHRFLADEPVQAGGMDTGPGPYDLLLSALGACTSMTIRLYADRKQIPLERTLVHLRHEKIYAADCSDCETKEGKIDHIDREITFEGNLDAATRARLLEIADKCPVHRTLKSEVDIRTVEKPTDQPVS
jgi:putative redox protein